MEDNYVTIYEEYKHKFVQIPKVFFTSNRYINMSNNAKIAWALLRERSSLSKKNKWFDETGRIYFIFQNKELMELLNFGSENTLIKVKKELIKKELVVESRFGRNKPNKLYLKYPIIENNDIDKIDEFEGYIEEQHKEARTLDTGGTAKNEASKSEVPELQKVQSSNTEYSNTEFKRLDTLDTKDTSADHLQKVPISHLLNDQERENQKEKYMKNAFYQNRELVPENLSKMLQVFSTSTEQAKRYYDIILSAKKNVEKEMNVMIWLENEPELEHEIINTFSRSIRKIQREGKIENRAGYIYKALYHMLSSKIAEHNRAASEQNELYNQLAEWFGKES